MTKEELGKLILESERQLYATAKTILACDYDCEDAIQEAITKAFSKIHTLKKDCFAKTWLMRILINECYNVARKNQSKNYLDENFEYSISEAMCDCDYSELYRAVNSLKDNLKLPVILYYMEGFNVKEVASILDVSEGAVQKRLARAREKLKNTIQLEEISA